jgi:4a-hydroxytetrahydrobiopterin dehydratase
MIDLLKSPGEVLMDDLTRKQCEPCRVGASKVTLEEIAAMKPQIPDWDIVTPNGIDVLERAFRFDDFAQALAFTVKLGELAEKEGHHPAILTEWGRVTVSWWTHKIAGLHANDFIMAAKTDYLYTQGRGSLA